MLFSLWIVDDCDDDDGADYQNIGTYDYISIDIRRIG